MSDPLTDCITEFDLHCHSTVSDGKMTPRETVAQAAKSGVKILALTDHDTVSGVSDAKKACEEQGLRLIPAVEINADRQQPVHILGFFVNEQDPEFLACLDRYRQRRLERLQKIVTRLRQLDVKIPWGVGNEDKALKNQHSLGRPHIADLLVAHGYAKDRDHAFERYLAKGRPAFAPSEGPLPQEAIQSILLSGGVPVLAHPLGMISASLIEELVQAGLQGIEVYYERHKPAQISRYEKLARERGLVMTGGSDFHGQGTGHETIGRILMPKDTVEKLEERHLSLNQRNGNHVTTNQ